MGRLRRLWVPSLPEAGGSLTLPLESFEHVQVLRLGAGAAVELFDGQGRIAQGELTRVTKREVECEVQVPIDAPPRSPRLQLVVCLPKASKPETIVRMTTELGVAGIHLAVSERSVPKAGSDAKLERLRRVAREACAQSGNLRMPVLTGPQPLAAAAAGAPADALKLVFWEEASEAGPAAVGGREEIWAVIGPEGGLTSDEVAALEASGYARIGLGAHILRVETACVVVAAVLLERSGWLRGVGGG